MKKIGKYEIIEELGKGATSIVYRAFDPFANREVAIKVISPEVLIDKEHGNRYKKLFITEASLAGKLSHPHIVAIFDAVSDDNLSYIVMEYVKGGTLEQYCSASNLLPIEKIIEMVFKCCKALDYAHRSGIVHRDIKPANILLQSDTDIKISDFGTALSISSETTQVSGVGSPAYMSPQQLKDMALTHQSDIFSLGVVLYQTLTGILPFKGANNYGIIYKIIHSDPPFPSIHRPEIPASLDAIVMKALQKKVEDRYQSWEEFSHDLVTAFSNLQKPEQDVAESEKFNALRRMAFFEKFTDVELWEVLRIGSWKRLPAGAPLLQEGEPGHAFFILVSGEVKVTKQGKLLNVLKPGECFGEMAYLAKSESNRTASVATLSNVLVIEFSTKTLAHASEQVRHRFDGAFLEILVTRLALANTRLSQLLTDRNISVF
jgi:eukaryotic-like serine/threonine-protein kinase